jgi:hypothetical protein
MTLSQVPRELAERLVPHPQTCTEQYCTCTGWLIENRFRVEAVIREAMQKAIEATRDAVYWKLYDDRGAMDSRDYAVLKEAMSAIDKAASSLTEQETTR